MAYDNSKHKLLVILALLGQHVGPINKTSLILNITRNSDNGSSGNYITRLELEVYG